MKIRSSLAVFLVTLIFGTSVVYAAGPMALAEDATVAVASVVSVDTKTRVVTLAGPEGDHFTFTAGTEVRNFD